MRRLLPARFIEALRSTPVELPGDLARESRRRVRVAAGIGAAAYAVFLAFELGPLRSATAIERFIDRTHDLVGLGLCGALLLATRWRALTDRTVFVIALVVEILLAALISIAAPWAAWVRTAHVPGLTWVVPIVILFPLLVPAPPRTALLVSTLAVLTMPAGLWVLSATGRVRADASDLVASALTGAVAAAIAAVSSLAVYGARRQAAAARRVGSYELLEPLGRGGMGEVWKAHHALLARPAAVKLIQPDQLRGPSEERDELVRRFTREAQTTAGLRSPHTITLFDFGVSAEGTFYYAMELLDGINLEHFVYRYGPIEPRRVVSWLVQVCHSLGEAHALQLVHRDIKPGNLLVCRYGRDVDFIKVLDFGLTRSAAAPQTDTDLTARGAILGTPGYMAPEQVFGLSAGPSADLYALGCVGYWLLSGHKPFEGETAGELMRQHAQAAPPPLPRVNGRAVPERLERVIMACLAKDPAERPADADRLSEDLRRCLDDDPWTPADARKWWEEHAEA